MLTFDPAAHAYRWNNALVPSVTQILRPLYDFSGIHPAVLENKRQIGTAVHLACELIDQNRLDASSVAPELAGYLVAYREFLAAKKPEWALIESRVYHPIGFAGTLDRAGDMDGPAILDVKTGPESPAIGVQLAAYLKAANLPPNTRRYALHLREDGTYRLVEHADRNDWPTFLSCLNLHNWKARHAA